jgi:hypothetical protein
VFESEPSTRRVAEADRENRARADEFDDLVNMAAHLADASTATLCIAESGRLRLAASHPAPLPAVTAATWPVTWRCGRRWSATPRCCTYPTRGIEHVARPAAPCRTGSARVRARRRRARHHGQPLGVLCVADAQPRATLSDGLVENLHRLARVATRLIERRALQRSNRIAGQIAQADFSGVIVVDAIGCVTYANTAAGNLFGGRAVLGANCTRSFPPACNATRTTRSNG